MGTSRDPTAEASTSSSAAADGARTPAASASLPSCDNCGADDEIAFTLTTYVDGGDDHVELHFCSTDCLRVWT